MAKYGKVWLVATLKKKYGTIFMRSERLDLTKSIAITSKYQSHHPIYSKSELLLVRFLKVGCIWKPNNLDAISLVLVQYSCSMWKSDHFQTGLMNIHKPDLSVLQFCVCYTYLKEMATVYEHIDWGFSHARIYSAYP